MKINLGLGVVNLTIMTFLAFRLGVPFVNETGSILSQTDSIGIFLAAQASQYALLQVILAALGLGMAIVALWGYFTIKEGAENMAERTVKEAVPKLFNEMLEKFGKETVQQWVFEKNMETPQQKKSNEVFIENVEEMFRDPEEIPNE